MIKFPHINRIFAIFISVLFALNSTAICYADSLQVWSKVAQPTREFLAATALKNVLARMGEDIGNYNTVLTSRLDENTIFSLDLRRNDNGTILYGKEKSGADWTVYCSVTVDGAATQYRAVIHPDKSFEIEKLPAPEKRPYAIVHLGEKNVIKPLEGIDPESIKNILVYTDVLHKLGDTTISFWPLVSSLYSKFPNATIHVKCSFFKDIFAAKMFQGRIKQADVNPLTGVEFAKSNNIDMVFDLSVSQNLSDKLIDSGIYADKSGPYIFSLTPPTLSAPQMRFIDKLGAQYNVSGEKTIKERSSEQASAVTRAGMIISPSELKPNLWGYSIGMCRALGLAVTNEDLPVKIPTMEESISGFTILKKWFDESNLRDSSSKFDPAKKIIVINIYAVTQSNLVSDREWVMSIVELVKNVKDAYFLFTCGGPMDADALLTARIVGMVKRELANDGTIENDVIASNIILPKFESIYPYIHEILGVTTAFITVDTGLGHLASGVYDIPTAIITSTHILHWLPTRESTTAIIAPSLEDRDMIMAMAPYKEQGSNPILAGWQRHREEAIVQRVKSFAKKIDHDPERVSVKTVKLAAAAIEDRARLDRELIAGTTDSDCLAAKKDVREYLNLRLDALGLSKAVEVPEIKFVDSSTQTELKTPRLTTKLGVSSQGVAYLMIDRSILKRSPDGTYFVPMEERGMDILHEIAGHLAARKLFSVFEDTRKPTTMIRKSDNTKTRDRVAVHIRITEEEVMAKLMTILALHKLYNVDSSLVQPETVEAMSKLGADLKTPDINAYFRASLKWMKNDKNVSALRYRWLLTPGFEDRLLMRARENYFPKILETMGVVHQATPWSSVSCDLSDPAGVAKGLVSGIVSTSLNRKVVLLFDNNIAGAGSRMLFSVIEEVNRLKKEPKYGKFLKNVTIVISDISKVSSRLNEYKAERDTAVFLFTRLSQRDVTKGVEGVVHAVYVDDEKFPQDPQYYYPLCEMVTLVLTQFVNGSEEIDKIRPNIESKLKLKMEEMGGVTVFMFLETPRQLNTEDLRKRYGLLKDLLSNA